MYHKYFVVCLSNVLSNFASVFKYILGGVGMFSSTESENDNQRLVNTMYSFQPYQERLQSLNLYSMEYRRKRGDMIQAYTILKKIDRIDHSKFFTRTKYKGTRRHSMKLFKPLFESEL